jgi:hypothetical protein
MHKSIWGELETLEVQLLLKKTLVDGRGCHAKFFGFHDLRHGVTERWRRKRAMRSRHLFHHCFSETFVIAGELFLSSSLD